MPRHLISDAHEWINEIPTVPIYYLAKPQPRERTWEDQRGKKTLLSLTVVDPKAHPLHVGCNGPRTLPTNRTSSNSGRSQTPFVPVFRESRAAARLSCLAPDNVFFPGVILVRYICQMITQVS